MQTNDEAYQLEEEAYKHVVLPFFDKEGAVSFMKPDIQRKSFQNDNYVLPSSLDSADLTKCVSFAPDTLMNAYQQLQEMGSPIATRN